MKTYTHACALLCSIALIGCQKEDELPGEEDLLVKASTINSVDGPGTIEPLVGKDVFVALEDDANGFLYSAKTDANGHVLFEGLMGDQRYRVYAQDVVGANGVVVRGEAVVLGNASDLELLMTPGGNGQNGFVITATTSDGSPRAGLPIRVYTSLSLAQLDQPATALLNGTADAFGRVFKLGIAEGSYHARVRNQAAGIDSLFMIEVAADGIVFKTIAIGASVDPPTGIWLRCTDGSGTGVPGLTVLGFANEALAQVGDSATSSFICPSIGYGQYLVSSIEAGQYFLSVRNAPNGIDTIITTVAVQGVIDSTEVQVMP